MKKYRNDLWYTSPWNFLEEVRKDMNFHDDIQIHDVTLRDGEQQSGLILNAKEKVKLAEKMAQVGINRIEAGMPAVSSEDEKAIKEIVKNNFGPDVFAFGRCTMDDVARAADCGVKGIIIEIPSNEELIKTAYKWELEKAIELSVKATNYAKELGLYTVFFPIDMTRSDMNWVLSLIENVANHGHMDALAVVDTFGGLNPHTVPYLIKKIKSRIDKPLECHFHDDFGLGSANTLAGLAAGAEVMHTTISASGERAGNASYEDVVMSLLTMYGVDLGLDYSKIYELSKMFREMTGLNVRSNRGIFGDNIFDIESGIVAAWHENVKDENPLLLSPFLPELVGHKETRIVLGKHSGLPSVDYYCVKNNLDITVEQQKVILLNIKDLAYKKNRLITENEFLELVDKL